jgi:hypothetical protein
VLPEPAVAVDALFRLTVVDGAGAAAPLGWAAGGRSRSHLRGLGVGQFQV